MSSLGSKSNPKFSPGSGNETSNRRPARAEFDEAADLYEQRRTGLGAIYTAASEFWIRLSPSLITSRRSTWTFARRRFRPSRTASITGRNSSGSWFWLSFTPRETRLSGRAGQRTDSGRRSLPYSAPFDEGTPVCRGSTTTACLSARAVPLKIASAMWWLLSP